MECFIDLVRRNEILWDGSFEEYHTRTNKKKQAWECIAAEMSNDLKQVDGIKFCYNCLEFLISSSR